MFFFQDQLDFLPACVRFFFSPPEKYASKNRREPNCELPNVYQGKLCGGYPWSPRVNVQPHIGSDSSNSCPEDHNNECSMLTSVGQCLAVDILNRTVLCAGMSEHSMVVSIPYPRGIIPVASFPLNTPTLPVLYSGPVKGPSEWTTTSLDQSESISEWGRISLTSCHGLRMQNRFLIGNSCLLFNEKLWGLLWIDVTVGFISFYTLFLYNFTFKILIIKKKKILTINIRLMATKSV